MGDGQSFHVPAEAYDRFVGRYSAELARALIAAAGVRPGQAAVDVGCGPGGLTGELVALLGAESVAAVDPSPSFAQACAARNPGVRVAVEPAEALSFEDASFDVALAQLVVNFLADPLAGVREMARVTRRGGTVAAAVWDYGGEMTLLRAFWDAAASLDAAASAQDERNMRFTTPPELRRLWEDARLEGIDVQPAAPSASYESFDDMWAPLESGVGPAGAHAVGLEPEARAALREEMRARLGVGEEPFHLTARAWMVTGRVA
jgi:SAM-dependent methyltransferase